MGDYKNNKFMSFIEGVEIAGGRVNTWEEVAVLILTYMTERMHASCPSNRSATGTYRSSRSS